MHSLRLARAFTGRTKLLKFEGNFHGYHDQVMYSIGTPADRLGPPETPTAWPGSTGMPPGLAEQLVLVPYNRPDLLDRGVREARPRAGRGDLEPIYYNAGCILPTASSWHAVTTLPREHGVLLIFDEVLCAFRMGPGGAQEYLGVTPDLCTLGKAVGGGYPLSVFGGRREIMERLMPQGDCQHSGTYNGHPAVVAAGLAAVKAYREPGFYDHIHAVGERLFGGLNAIFEKHGVAARVQGLGARFGIYFGVGGPGARATATPSAHQREQMLRFIAAAIDHGVYFHDYGGAACHHGFCAAMTLEDVDDALSRLDDAVKSLGERGPKGPRSRNNRAW